MKYIWLLLSIFWRVFKVALLVAIIIGALVAAAYVLKLDDQVKTQFAGKLWALPARVFARPACFRYTRVRDTDSVGFTRTRPTPIEFEHC